MCKFATENIDASATSPAEIYEAIKEHLPSSPLVKKSYDYVSSRLLNTALLNHSLRTYLYAARVSTLSPVKPLSPNYLTLAFIAAIFHDFGLCEDGDGPDRFEICGANAAVQFLREHAPEFTEAEVLDVWTSMALHTSPGLPLHYSELTRAMRVAVTVDFDMPGIREKFGFLPDYVEQVEKVLPMLNAFEVLKDVVLKQILKRHGEARERKAPGPSWPFDVLREALEKEGSYEGADVHL